MDNACIILIMRKAWEGCLLPYPVSGAPGRAVAYAPKLALWFGTTDPLPPTQKEVPERVPLKQ